MLTPFVFSSVRPLQSQKALLCKTQSQPGSWLALVCQKLTVWIQWLESVNLSHLALSARCERSRFWCFYSSHIKGICIGEPLAVIVRKEFFIDLRLPYSAVTGEQLEVKAILHNYSPDIITVSLCSSALVFHAELWGFHILEPKSTTLKQKCTWSSLLVSGRIKTARSVQQANMSEKGGTQRS